MNIDKKLWKPYKLLDIVTKREENDRENAKNRFDRFLKVEHMDAESLHIKRWSSQSAGEEINPYFYKIFRKGQILFPTRNPHLRRTALASFDGICGEKTLTLEPNKELVIPEFIPFLFHSDKFYKHTTSIIIGSTNPHCRWRDVANYEFLLPPKEEQAKLAELLWAMDDVIEKEKGVLEKVTIIKSKLSDSYFNPKNYPNNLVKLGTVSKLTAGGTPNTEKKEYWENGNIPWLSSGEVHNKIIYKSDSFITEKGLKNSSAKLMPAKTIFIALAGQGKTKGTVAISEIETCTNQSVAAIMPKIELVEPYYLYYNLDSRYLDFRHITGKENSRTGLNLKILNEFKIVLHEDFIRKRILIEFKAIDENKNNIQQRISDSQSLQKSLINQIF